ncbi:MAG: hypothetical protein Ct9H90mP13_03640 [Pseudomonadota bacterium]|nr:MAG: hypothetical protein Ct9H90mP13_03640 [Pseudomonadota bacterium]
MTWIGQRNGILIRQLWMITVSIIILIWDMNLMPNLSDSDKLEIQHKFATWSLSQFLHGEQGALLVASQLCSCAPTYNAKLYAATQTYDEARHVEAFNKYIQTRPKADVSHYS